MAKTELERLVVVETKLDALIKSTNEQTLKLDRLLVSYVHRNEYEKDIEALRAEIEKTKARNAVQVWITSTLAALFGVIMTILVQKYFQG